MKHKFLTLIATILMIGCTTTTAVEDSPINDTVVTDVIVDDNSSTDILKICTHKYESSRNFTYLEPSGIKKAELDNKLTIYVIIDINNKEWFINNFEFENYNCIKG